MQRQSLVSRLRPLSWALLLAFAVQGCTEEEGPPPLFNAIDKSIVCEAGKIGWDFSTGGFEDEVRASAKSNELPILEATYGGNCNVTPGNWTGSFAASCNGNVECTRRVNTSAPDPAPQCAKDFRVRYACGVEQLTYEVYRPAEAGNQEITLRCGDVISIARASYGKNCNATGATGNLTTRVADACSGTRKCTLGRGGTVFGWDPAPGCPKRTEIEYLCGNDKDIRVVSFEESQDIDFQCGPRVLPTVPSAAIKIDGASYGNNCAWPSTGGNATARFQQSCDGKGECSLRAWPVGAADPKPGCAKDFQYWYNCGPGTPQEYSYFPGEAGARTINIACGEPILIISASYGRNAGAPQNNFLSRAKSACDGRRQCDFGPQTGNALFGSDPAPGRGKQFELTYSCGEDSSVKTAAFSEGERVSFRCPLGAARSTFATGIRAVSATLGTNCSLGTEPLTKVLQETLKNNALAELTRQCFGKDVCDYNSSGDPVPFCTEDLDVSWRCGEDPELFSAKLKGGTNPSRLRLSCEPAIKINSATYGKSCGKTDNNALNAFKEACQGKRGSCGFVVGNVGDPAPNCPKDFSATYSCGADPALKRIDIAAEAGGATAQFSCPVPATPYVRKECVPLQCYGRQRRDADLKCVADNTKPIIPPFAGASLVVTHTSTGAGTGAFTNLFSSNKFYELGEGIAYEIQAGLALSEGLADASFPRGAQVASGAVWAIDTFTPIAGGPKVEGFRCLIANVGMRRLRDGESAGPFVVPDRSRFLYGNATNTVIPPACYGQNILSWRDAAKRVGLNEAAFRSSYRMDSRSSVRLSFDHEGKTVARRLAATPVANAAVPNPIGFFYDAPKLWVDSLSYYRQTDVTDPGTSFFSAAFYEANAIGLSSRKAVVSNPRLRVSLTDAFELPELEVDFTWALEGDAPGRNPFSMTPRPLVSNISTLSQRNLGATVEITRKSLYDARPAGADWVTRADSMTVGMVQGTKLKPGIATGKTERLVAAFGDALRDRLLRIKAGNNDGWMNSATEASTELKARVCLDMDGMTRGNTDVSTPLSATRGASTFTAGFGRRCVVADQTILLERELTMKPFQETRAVTAAQTGRSTNQGDSALSTGHDIGGQNSCQKQCTVDADCPGARCSRVSGATSGLGVCTGDAATSSCSNVQRQSLGSGGSLGASQYSMTTSTASKRSASTTGAKSGTSVEALSFNVLDSSSGEGQNDQEAPWAFGWQTFKVSLAPNFSVIERALKGQELVPKPVKPKFRRFAMPAFEGIKRDGLSVGVGNDITLFISPVPIVIEFSAGVGLGLGLELEVAVNKEQEGNSTSPLYPCWGTSQCVRVSTSTATLHEARKACLDQGGRLAEAPTSAAFTALTNAVAAAPGGSSNEEFWVGGQLAYSYSDAKCWRFFSIPLLMPNDCINNSTTKYQWISSGRVIAEQANRGTSLLNAGSYASNFGGGASALSPLRTSVPILAGMVLTRGSNQFATVPLIGLFNFFPRRRYACEFEPAKSYDATKINVKASVEVSAGFNFAACAPSNAFGFCVAANLKLLFAEISLAYEYSNMNLFRASGSLMSNRMNHAIVGKWKWGFISGAIAAELRMLFFNLSWEIVKYEGLQTVVIANDPGAADKFSGTLFRIDWPSRKDYP